MEVLLLGISLLTERLRRGKKSIFLGEAPVNGGGGRALILDPPFLAGYTHLLVVLVAPNRH